MNRDEFIGLPPRLALGLLWDALHLDTKMLAVAPPKPPLPPKYDMKIYRRGGFNWASEMSLDGLVFWHKKATESAASGGQYAEKDAKKAASLERWINWRSCEPETVWTGERDNRRVTAVVPSRDPRLNASAGGNSSPATADHQTPPDDDDIPF